MEPTEQDLEIVRAKDDKARRARLVLVIVASLAVTALVVGLDVLGSASSLVGLIILGAAFLYAHRRGATARAHAMLHLGAIRREGLAATALLNQGDVAAAQRAYVGLLKKARPLGAFHAVHVLMYGVTRFFQGATQEGLRLAARALDSGWLDSPRMTSLRRTAESWQLLMLLASGDLAEAHEGLSTSTGPELATPRILLRLHREEWSDALVEAQRALADDAFPKAGRPTVSVLGLHAARKLGLEDAVLELEARLAAEPLGPLARRNPALTPFL